MQQLELYKDCQNELVKIAGKTNATSIISGAAYILVAGSGDFVENYYIYHFLRKLYTTNQFVDILMQCYSNFIQAWPLNLVILT
jgi:hypothetical protein